MYIEYNRVHRLLMALDTFPCFFFVGLKEKELEEGRVIMTKLAELSCWLGNFLGAVFEASAWQCL